MMNCCNCHNCPTIEITANGLSEGQEAELHDILTDRMEAFEGIFDAYVSEDKDLVIVSRPKKEDYLIVSEYYDALRRYSDVMTMLNENEFSTIVESDVLDEEYDDEDEDVDY